MIDYISPISFTTWLLPLIHMKMANHLTCLYFDYLLIIKKHPSSKYALYHIVNISCPIWETEENQTSYMNKPNKLNIIYNKLKIGHLKENSNYITIYIYIYMSTISHMLTMPY